MLKFSYRVVFHPAARRKQFSLVRDILRCLFSPHLVSLAMQVRDMRRSDRMQQKYVVNYAHHHKLLDYNARVTLIMQFTCTRREKQQCYGALSQSLRNLSVDRLLNVGHRNIRRLLIPSFYGFSWQNIEAIAICAFNLKSKS